MAAVILRLRNAAKTNFKSFSSSKRFKPKSLKLFGWHFIVTVSLRINSAQNGSGYRFLLFFLTQLAPESRFFFPFDKKLCRILKAYSLDIQHNHICVAINKTKIFCCSLHLKF